LQAAPEQVVLLDSGPLGMVSHPEAASRNTEAFEWFAGLLDASVVVEIPEIADYEVRRELLRAGKDRSVERLNELAQEIGYRALTTAVMHKNVVRANPASPTGVGSAMGAVCGGASARPMVSSRMIRRTSSSPNP
jgi:hypothetical protein